MKVPRIAVACTAAVFLLTTPAGLNSCGPFIPQAIFVTPHGPVDPNAGLTAGKLGVVRPEFRLAYLVVAYRHLAGIGLKPPDVQVLNSPAPHAEDAIGRWTAARSRFTAEKQNSIYPYKSLNRGNEYIGFQDCLDDAFINAAKTVEARAAAWGPASPALADWIAGQDAVFSNCTEKNGVKPGPPPASAPPLLRADRDYQLAAAAFYAGEWTDARNGFEQIALDKTSPWKTNAPYLIARAFIREGTIDNKPEALTAARARLAAILNDAASRSFHPSARKLLDYIDNRLTPASRLQTLSDALLKPQLSADSSQTMTDFLSLYWDASLAAPRKLNVSSDLTDWLSAWKGHDGPGSLARWRKTGSPQWLLAALKNTTDQAPEVPDLIKAAHQIPSASPAYLSVAYYASGLQQRRGEQNEARAWDDEALAMNLEPSDRNLFLTQRLSLARDWPEFLKYSPREIAYQSFFDDDANPVDPKDPSLKYANFGPAFDSDAANTWNSRIPLSLWIDGARQKILPNNLRAQIARAGWVRALVLDRPAEARTLLALWRETDPTTAALADSYMAAPDPGAARLAAALILLNNPGLDAFVQPGFGRLSKMNELDHLRQNWWCTLPETNKASSAPFLSAQQRTEGEQEALILTKTAQSGTNYVTAEVIRLAQAKPADPAIPEALARAVQATRYNPCGTTETGTLSQQAFNLLKQRYPNTSWARDTKYWYK